MVAAGVLSPECGGGKVLVRSPIEAHFHVNVIVKVDLSWSWPPHSPDVFTFLTILPVPVFLRAFPKFRKAPITFVMPVRMENVTLAGQTSWNFMFGVVTISTWYVDLRTFYVADSDIRISPIPTIDHFCYSVATISIFYIVYSDVFNSTI
jgi:hypothetical protein